MIQDTIAQHLTDDGRAAAMTAKQEIRRLQEQNRCLAVSLGGFSAFLASKGLLEEAWQFVHRVHQHDEGAVES